MEKVKCIEVAMPGRFKSVRSTANSDMQPGISFAGDFETVA